MRLLSCIHPLAPFKFISNALAAIDLVPVDALEGDRSLLLSVYVVKAATVKEPWEKGREEGREEVVLVEREREREIGRERDLPRLLSGHD
jgi:hypothetical protein